MIVNLAEQTKIVLDSAQLSEHDIEYVIYHRGNSDNKFYCSYDEFIEMAEDINYDQFDGLTATRRMINKDLMIVADTWMLHRTEDDDEVEGWVYKTIPPSIDNLINGDGFLESIHLVNDDDNYDASYVDMVTDTDKEYPYVKASTIEINGNTFNIIDDNGVDKIINKRDNTVAIILSSVGKYWSAGDVVDKDIRMLFHPELIKMVMEDIYLDRDVFNMQWIRDEFNFDTTGFSDDSFFELGIAWIPRGVKFDVVAAKVTINDTPHENVVYRDDRIWLDS